MSRRKASRWPTPGEDDFCDCGGPLAYRNGPTRYCSICDKPEPTKRLHVRLPNDSMTWMPVGAAIARAR